jgi:hypothetical protein
VESAGDRCDVQATGSLGADPVKRIPFGILILSVCCFSLSARSIASAKRVLTSVAISGSQSVLAGKCAAFRITAVAQDGLPFKVGLNRQVALSLLPTASVVFSAKSSGNVRCAVGIE